MNERIRKLYGQALETKFDYGAGANVKPGEYYSNYITVLNHEKFAALIVQECAKSANDWYQNHDKIHSDPMSYVLAHFGVEE